MYRMFEGHTFSCVLDKSKGGSSDRTRVLYRSRNAVSDPTAS
jgi:hypothetical protein